MFSLALSRHDCNTENEDDSWKQIENSLRRRLDIKEVRGRTSTGADSPPWLQDAIRDQSNDTRVYSFSAIAVPRVGDSDEDDSGSQESRELRKEIAKLREQNRGLQTQLKDAVSSVKTFHSQQRKLYDGFKILRSKYDDLKADSAVTMWEYIPSKIKGFEELGETNISIFESSTRIGDYTIGELLGEGQFADVKLATSSKSSRKLAVKIMRKDRVHSVQALKRIHNEIAVLRKADHENIVKFHDVILSTKYVYLFVEQGGDDLFDFFDKHLKGVDHRTAREIILGITLPIAYLHDMQICHRDLKPENVLLKIVPGKEIQSADIQICDFGLCCQKVKPHSRSLSEFCGSPGFFAPEMVLGGGKYNGLAVDVWSIGCILLELTLGHDVFCKSWMSAYDFEIIQRPSAFEDSIHEAVENLNLDSMNAHMEDFIKQLLVIDPECRASSESLLECAWFDDHHMVGKKRRFQSESMQSIDLETKMVHISDFKTDGDGSEPNSPIFAFGLADEDGEGVGSMPVPMPMAEAKSDGSIMDIVQSGNGMASSYNSSDNDLAALSSAKSRIMNTSSPNAAEAKADGRSRQDSAMSSTSSNAGGNKGKVEATTDKFNNSLSLRARRHFGSQGISVNTEVAKKYSSVARVTGQSAIRREERDGGDSGSPLLNEMSAPRPVRTSSMNSDELDSPPVHPLSINLPPIDPATPSLRSAKKTLAKGSVLLRGVGGPGLITEATSPMTPDKKSPTTWKNEEGGIRRSYSEDSSGGGGSSSVGGAKEE
ncbi:hypothetical protein TrLO_g3734 [Triparma laevis f. longispina]|uniref:Protein kinase domain-containing protein n=1 Tax=Triparma laevis f. longispina TaxID=1714387 RepID=A0A9W7CH43_9STRA|nr:hypothetical protein TrLO_g3734 [Triparma laevis f. longispina]